MRPYVEGPATAPALVDGDCKTLTPGGYSHPPNDFLITELPLEKYFFSRPGQGVAPLVDAHLGRAEKGPTVDRDELGGPAGAVPRIKGPRRTVGRKNKKRA